MICSAPSLVALEVGDELHEVVGLPVEAERVQPPQRERRVAHPAVAVVPVALATGRLGQRGGRGGDRRAGRRVGQSLQRQRRALQMLAPPVVREAPAGEPVAPVVEGGLQALLGVRAVLGAVRGRAVQPSATNRSSPSVSVCRARARLPSIPIRRSEISRSTRLAVGRLGGRPVLLDHLPPRRRAPVVEHRLAHRLDLNRALDALDHAAPACGRRRDRSAAACATSRRRDRRATARSSARRGRRSSPTASSTSSR